MSQVDLVQISPPMIPRLPCCLLNDDGASGDGDELPCFWPVGVLGQSWEPDSAEEVSVREPEGPQEVQEDHSP